MSPLPAYASQPQRISLVGALEAEVGLLALVHRCQHQAHAIRSLGAQRQLLVELVETSGRAIQHVACVLANLEECSNHCAVLLGSEKG